MLYSPFASRARTLRIFVVLLLGVPLAILYALNAGAPRLPQAHGVYVWQYAWSPSVHDAVVQRLDTFEHALIFCAEVSTEGDDFTLHRAYPGWRALANTAVPLWGVIRVRTAVTAKIDANASEVATHLATLAQTITAEAAASGVTLAGMQIDYDCPTRALPAYAALTAALHHAWPEMSLSITALPTWLGQPALADVVSPLANFTLQVHSLDRPARVDDPIVLCDAPRIRGWLDQAGHLKKPFYLALPTYTYRLYFAPTGEFVALGAEGAPHAAPEYTTRDARADPEAMAEIVRALQADAPRNCLGIQWFRLPVEGDTLNWSWPVLAAVMQGVAPQARFRAEVRTPQPGLYEVWVSNEGSHTPLGRVSVPLHWAGCEVAAEDALGDFHLAGNRDSTVVLSGTPPSPGETRMAAWFRMACDTAQFNADPAELAP